MIENNKGGLAILTGEDRFYEAWQMEIHFFLGCLFSLVKIKMMITWHMVDYCHSGFRVFAWHWAPEDVCRQMGGNHLKHHPIPRHSMGLPYLPPVGTYSIHGLFWIWGVRSHHPVHAPQIDCASCLGTSMSLITSAGSQG